MKSLDLFFYLGKSFHKQLSRCTVNFFEIEFGGIFRRIFQNRLYLSITLIYKHITNLTKIKINGF